MRLLRALVVAFVPWLSFACGGKASGDGPSPDAAGGAPGSAADAGELPPELESHPPVIGYYFFIVELAHEGLRIPFYAEVEGTSVATRETFRGLFGLAIRRVESNQRPGCPSCSGDSVCALFPAPSCVSPGAAPLALEHFPDFLPGSDSPDGDFGLMGHVVKEGNGYRFDVDDNSIMIGDYENPKMRWLHADIDWLLQPSQDRWRAEGQLNIGELEIEGVSVGETEGTLQAMTLTHEEVDAIESFGFPLPMFW